MRDGCALKAKLLAGKQRARWRGPGISNKTVAVRIDRSIRGERRSARSIPDRGEIDSEADRCPVRKLVVEPGKLPTGVALVARDEFVEADAGVGQRLPVDTGVPDIRGDAPVLKKQTLGADMDRTDGRALVDVLEVAKTRADLRERRQRDVHVRHAAHGVIEVRRVEGWHEGYGRRWNQRIGKQVVIKVLTIAAEASLEIVDSPLGNIHKSAVNGISAVAEAVRREAIEQKRMRWIHGVIWKELSRRRGPDWMLTSVSYIAPLPD